MGQSFGQKLYRVRFVEAGEKTPIEVVVSSVKPSDFIGLVTLEDFVFNDQRKFVISPEEDTARRRFGKTERLHVPYHSLVYVEEFFDAPADVTALPFVKAVPTINPENQPS